MAADVGVQMVFTVMGAQGLRSGRIHINWFSDVALSTDDAPSLMQTVWDFIKPMQNGRLAGASFNINSFFQMDEFDDPTNQAATIADVEEQALFEWSTQGRDHTSSILIPCFREELFIGSGKYKTVDLSNADVAAFVTAMTTGIPVDLSNNLYHTTRRGELLTRLYKDPTQEFNWRLAVRRGIKNRD